MNAEFNWWLLLVGLAIGAGLTWVVLEDRSRVRDSAPETADDAELAAEATWIASQLGVTDRPIEADDVAEVLRLHDEYANALTDGWTPRPETMAQLTPSAAAGRDHAPVAAHRDDDVRGRTHRAGLDDEMASPR